MIAKYCSPVGEMLLAAEDGKLIGLWLAGQRHFGSTLPPVESLRRDAANDDAANDDVANNNAIFLTVDWLTRYFRGETPTFTPPMEMRGTKFQLEIWNYLMSIPPGSTTAYGQIARDLGTSPRAVGNAVARNPLLILVPCHRVLASDGSPGGYAAGEAVKRRLLQLEKGSGSIS